ncbi:MAG TPA: hypothetical protein VND88_02640 [Candidatus Acidoferrales bacterium]|nr:hypothetical protein [Candidatus Acidoferrales bacterium]
MSTGVGPQAADGCTIQQNSWAGTPLVVIRTPEGEMPHTSVLLHGEYHHEIAIRLAKARPSESTPR